MINKKAQEEMIGFAMIIVIVGILLVIFLGFSLNKKTQAVESYEVESFIQSFLQYTTECAENYEPEYDNIQRLIITCGNKEQCVGNVDSCELLNSISNEILDKSWTIQEGGKIQGYELNIISNNESIVFIEKGNKTNNYKSSMQDFKEGLSGNLAEVYITIYE